MIEMITWAIACEKRGHHNMPTTQVEVLDPITRALHSSRITLVHIASGLPKKADN